MFKKSVFLSTVAGAIALSAAAFAANPMVGGAEMFADKNIVENAVNSKDHTTLVAAVTAAGLVDTLKGPARSQCSHRSTLRLTPCRLAPSTRC